MASAINASSIHASLPQMPPTFPLNGEGSFRYAPRARGGEPESPQAFQISSPLVYSPLDHVTSSLVVSADSSVGGSMKSSACTFSPTLTRQGNSPATKLVAAIPPEKCLKERP